MNYLSEVIAFVLGLVLMYFLNYFKGYATEKGRQRASGLSEKRASIKDKDKIYDYIKQKEGHMVDIKELNNNLFKGKKDVDYLDDLLYELQFERKVRNIKIDQFKREEQKWRLIE